MDQSGRSKLRCRANNVTPFPKPRTVLATCPTILLQFNVRAADKYVHFGFLGHAAND